MADGASVETERWQAGFDDVISRIAGRFSRVEPRRRVAAFLRGLMAGLPRVNCWTLAEQAGEATPDGMQHLLARAVWDERAVQGDLRDYVVQALGETDGVLIVDETGDVKKGTGTVGVQRQYTGTAGRIENAQVGVYLVYASRRGYAFLDRALYLPRCWTDDQARCAAAGVPAGVEFATKPALARDMISAALDAGVPARWVTGDEVYGADSRLRADLITRGVGYVLAVAKTHRIVTGIGTRRAIDLAVRLPAHAWFRQSAGPGAKGPRIYDWACVQTTDPAADRAVEPATEPASGDAVGEHGLLIRRNIRTKELAFYRTFSPTPVPLNALVRVAGTRWKIEESFQSGKELTGLDEHQVRTWTSWHRWTVLVMLAHAFLSVMTATTTTSEATDDDLIPLTRNETRRLFTSLTRHPQPPRHLLHWSHWRRRHQARARDAHHRRRQDHKQ